MGVVMTRTSISQPKKWRLCLAVWLFDCLIVFGKFANYRLFFDCLIIHASHTMPIAFFQVPLGGLVVRKGFVAGSLVENHGLGKTEHTFDSSIKQKGSRVKDFCDFFTVF